MADDLETATVIKLSLPILESYDLSFINPQSTTKTIPFRVRLVSDIFVLTIIFLHDLGVLSKTFNCSLMGNEP